jgi:hypothetical protein
VAWRGRVAEMTERERRDGCGQKWRKWHWEGRFVEVGFGWLVGGRRSSQREKAGGWSPVWRGRVSLLVYVSGWCFV